MIRLENSRLFVEAQGDEVGDLDTNYQLGTEFTVRIEASNGRIRITYNNASSPQVDLDRPRTGCYFKAGAYTQSNLSRGCASANAYGEVIIRDLSIQHTP
jgi:poly(beta-D-mannuronate) lyase